MASVNIPVWFSSTLSAAEDTEDDAIFVYALSDVTDVLAEGEEIEEIAWWCALRYVT